MRSEFKAFLSLGLAFFLLLPALYADEPIMVKITAVIASNQGSDFDLENDAYRDQLFKLFSYTSYKDAKQYALRLEKVQQEILALPGDYEFILTYRGQRRGNAVIGARIQKEGRTFLDTDIVISRGSPAFLGGPPIDSGALLLVIETLP